MPLIFQKYYEDVDCTVGIWERDENEDYLKGTMDLTEAQHKFIDSMKPFRRKEWLCSRKLLQELLPDQNTRLYKDNFGKPFLENSPYFISLSHSQNRAAAIVSKTLVGIDIQAQEDKISRIYPKFISDQEQSALDKDHLVDSYHIFWSAKEAMYKAYGLKSLDFRRHMHLYAFDYFNTELELAGFVKKSDLVQDYDIFANKFDNFYLVFAVLNSSQKS